MAQSGSKNLISFVERMSRRSLLTAAEQEALLGLPFHAEQVEASRDFVRLGETVNHVSLIAAGFVGRFDLNSKGARQITAIHIPGDAVNLHSVVQPQATAALHSLSDATILRIPHQAVRTVAARYPAIAEALWRDCAVDAAISSQWILNIGRRDAQSRVAHVLCELATKLDAVPEGNSFTLPFLMTQVHLADATGLTGVHVNRVLRRMRDAGIVHIQHREVLVHDWAKLRDAGDFDPAYLQLNVGPEERLRIVGM